MKIKSTKSSWIKQVVMMKIINRSNDKRSLPATKSADRKVKSKVKLSGVL